jgi:hypothetical protein
MQLHFKRIITEGKWTKVHSESESLNDQGMILLYFVFAICSPESSLCLVFDKGKPSENTNSNNNDRSIASCEMNPNLSQLSSTTSTSSMTSDTKISSLVYGAGFD